METEATNPAGRNVKPGRQRMPDHLRRKVINTVVSPVTLTRLQGLLINEADTLGHVIDRLVVENFELRQRRTREESRINRRQEREAS